MKKISVVVPNYNGRKFLKDCFDSLFATNYSPLEVIMVDNASTDDSVELVESCYPKVKIIKAIRNFGFAKAVNLGIKGSRGDYLAILNNDTVVDPRWLIELKKTIDSHPRVGFWASKMVWLKNPKIIDSAGIVYSWKGKAYDRGHGEKDEGQYDQLEYVFGACNGASFYQRSVFEKIGFFDEKFFLVADDVDFSFRAQLAGIKCLYVPTAIVKHAGGGTVITWTEKKARFSAKHHLYIIIKNFPNKFIFLNLSQILMERLRNFSGIIKSVSWWRKLPVVLITYGEVILNLPEMLKKRRWIQKKRKVSDEYLISLIQRADFSAD